MMRVPTKLIGVVCFAVGAAGMANAQFPSSIGGAISRATGGRVQPGTLRQLQAVPRSAPIPRSNAPRTVTPGSDTANAVRGNQANFQGSQVAKSPSTSGGGKVNVPAAITDEPKEKHALIVATRDYSSAAELPSLEGTNRDAELIQRALEKGGFPRENIALVYDDADAESFRPSGLNIKMQMRRFIQRADSGVACIFLIGHGISHQGTSYYCAQDTTDAVLQQPAENATGLVSINELAQTFSDSCRAEHKLVVVDACRSPASGRYEGLVKTLSDLEKPASDVWLLSSCSEGQRSWTSKDLMEGQWHPVFTFFLAKGLEGAADLLGDNDGRVGLFELFTYAHVKTSETVAAFERKPGERPIKQSPELFGVAPPFELATVGNLVARRTLTTGNVQAEARRSAEQVADDMLLNLREAEAEFRARIGVEEEEAEQLVLQGIYREYLQYLLGNRIDVALNIDPECRLAHVAKGITYRAAGTYTKAFDEFTSGEERFELFVKSTATNALRHVSLHEGKSVVLGEDGKPIANLQVEGKSGRVPVFTEPGGGTEYSIPREAKISVSDVRIVGDTEWFEFNSVNNTVCVPVWIERQYVHWLPDAVDLYTPSTVMRPMATAASTVSTRLDYAADRIYRFADVLSLPSRRLSAFAVVAGRPADRMRQVAANTGQVADQVGGAYDRARAVAGRFGLSLPSRPTPVRNVLYRGAYYMDFPSYYLGRAAAYAAIPSGWVRTGGNYVQMPAGYARSIEGWTNHAVAYQSGHLQQEKIDKQRKELENGGDLGEVEAKKIFVVSFPWNPDSEKKDKKDKKPRDI